MQRSIFQMSLILSLVFAGICLTNTALAGKPDWAGGKRGENHKHEEQSEKYRDNRTSDHGKYDGRNEHGGNGKAYFSEQNQTFIHQYYSDQFRQGRCPPGLLKRGNRCIPHGHATKMWKKGRQLPREVIFYNLPPSILGRLGPAPPRHRFVRVAQDILLISIGTGMVVDAFEDIGR